jgi:serine-type D-Ala-D-Ala carboxypeptidase/endopeptidase (penicillin-binding protein 4)
VNHIYFFIFMQDNSAMRTKFLLFGLMVCHLLPAQNITVQLDDAIKKLAADAQFTYGTLAMYVVNSKTGQLVYERNAETGMAPASCQKVVTSITAFELLGKNYQYATKLGYTGSIANGVLTGNLILTGSGDPTLGSWRYGSTKENGLLDKWMAAIKAKGIKSVEGSVFVDERNFTSASIPDGWIWQDMGNYYGAGAQGLNWRENQFDLVLQSGNVVGGEVRIKSIKPPEMEALALSNELTAGEKGSGDNAYIYTAPYTNNGFVRGTIPVGENNFTISGSVPDAPQLLAEILVKKLQMAGITVREMSGSFYGPIVEQKKMQFAVQPLLTITSPSLDSINYWFLKKSVNLYGEALVKTMAVQQQKPGCTDSGVALIRRFWQAKGIPPAALKVMDGSGLSPQNRVTAKALVTVMQYAKSRDWYPSFFNALPVMNGISMKDGYINGVRSYTGYVKSKSGAAYTFCLMVNNFDGSAATVREKMWKLLDVLKQ